MKGVESSLSLVLVLLLVSVPFANYIAPSLGLDSIQSVAHEENSSNSDEGGYGDDWYRRHGVPVPMPFPDEDINRYIGKIGPASMIKEICLLIEERYPGHCPLIEFKMIEADQKWIIDRGGQRTLAIHFLKIQITEILGHGVLGPHGEVLEPPAAEQTKSEDSTEQTGSVGPTGMGPYYYSETLEPGYA